MNGDLKRFATNKKLRFAWLKHWGVSEYSGGGLAFGYRNIDGSAARSQRRINVDTSHPTIWLGSGDEEIVPYGLWHLAKWREQGKDNLALVEGTSDALTLWSHDYAALGIPGASMYQKLCLEYIEGFLSVYVHHDGDKAGEEFVANVAMHLRAIGFEGEIHAVRFTVCKDVSELHCMLNGDTQAFARTYEVSRKQAVDLMPYAEIQPEADAYSDSLEWPDEDKAPWPTLHDAALYGLAGDIVRSIAPHTEADPAALLFTLLAAAGSMIGLGPHLRTGAAEQPARLNVVVVGNSSKARKGQSFSEIMAILREAEPETMNTILVSGLASGEGLVARLRDRDDEKSVEKRALVFEPEFARLLAVAGREGATVSAIVRDAFDRSVLEVNTRKDPIKANGVHVALVGHITHEELLSRLSSTEIANGFANRMLYVCARRAKHLPDGGRLPDSIVIVLGNRLREALTRARTFSEIRRSEEFSSAWKELYSTFGDESGLFGTITARAETLTLRLALIYTLLDGAEALRLDHLIAGYAAWRYAEASTRHIFGQKLGDGMQQRLLDALREKFPGGLERSAQNSLFAHHIDRVAAARESLVKRGLAVERQEPTAGRSRSVLYAIPSDKSDLSDKSPSVDPLLSLLSLKSQSGDLAQAPEHSIISGGEAEVAASLVEAMDEDMLI